MSRTIDERKAPKMLDIPDFRHMTKEKAVQLVSMSDRVDPSVVKAVLEQYPQFANVLLDSEIIGRRTSERHWRRAGRSLRRLGARECFFIVFPAWLAAWESAICWEGFEFRLRVTGHPRSDKVRQRSDKISSRGARVQGRPGTRGPTRSDRGPTRSRAEGRADGRGPTGSDRGPTEVRQGPTEPGASYATV